MTVLRSFSITAPSSIRPVSPGASSSIHTIAPRSVPVLSVTILVPIVAIVPRIGSPTIIIVVGCTRIQINNIRYFVPLSSTRQQH